MAVFKVGRWRSALAVLALMAAASAAPASEPNGWQGFYRVSPAARVDHPGVAPTPVPVGDGVCLNAILQAQARYGIPDNLLLAIGIQEAGRRVNGELTVWPWTANAAGKGKFFGSKAALEAWVRQTQAAGTRSIDVGCMQINQRWHADQFSSLEEATDPIANVDYAARFLQSLYSETRDWWQAAGRYHSSTETHKAVYLGKLEQNQRLANAQLAQFAGAAQSVIASSDEPAAPRRLPSINWSSDMTGTNAAVMHNALSIYSATPLRAVLPNYAEAD